MNSKSYGPLMTTREVAEFFNVSPAAVHRWMCDGKLQACSKVPGDIRFNPEYIHSLTTVDIDSNLYTPWRCRKLEREVEELKEQVNYYKQILTQIDILTSQVRCENLKNKK